MAVVLTLVQTKQIRINIHKRNNTKNTVQALQNTVNTITHITKTPTHYKTHTKHPYITKPARVGVGADTVPQSLDQPLRGALRVVSEQSNIAKGTHWNFAE